MAMVLQKQIMYCVSWCPLPHTLHAVNITRYMKITKGKHPSNHLTINLKSNLTLFDFPLSLGATKRDVDFTDADSQVKFELFLLLILTKW